MYHHDSLHHHDSLCIVLNPAKYYMFPTAKYYNYVSDCKIQNDHNSDKTYAQTASNAIGGSHSEGDATRNAAPSRQLCTERHML